MANKNALQVCRNKLLNSKNGKPNARGSKQKKAANLVLKKKKVNIDFESMTKGVFHNFKSIQKNK